MRIGELGRLVGVAPATIRYYERRGVLSRPERTPTGYRSYPAEAGVWIRLNGGPGVKQAIAAEMGFSGAP